MEINEINRSSCSRAGWPPQAVSIVLRTSSGLVSSDKALNLPLACKRLVEFGLKARAVDLDGAELAQMVGYELRVEHDETAMNEPGTKVDECDLRRVALRREHAFAEKCPAQGNAVEPADKATVRSAHTSTVWQWRMRNSSP